MQQTSDEFETILRLRFGYPLHLESFNLFPEDLIVKIYAVRYNADTSYLIDYHRTIMRRIIIADTKMGDDRWIKDKNVWKTIVEYYKENE